MKILILGGSGFVGKNLAIGLSSFHDIHVSMFKTFPTGIKGHIPIIYGDLTNKDDVSRIIGSSDFDVVINCAAVTSGSHDILTRPSIHVSPNILINTLVIDECVNRKIPLYIGLSCTVVYPPTEKLMKEDEKICDIYPSYFGSALSKITMEKLCEFYSKIQSDTKFCIIRHSNLYGEYDKYDDDSSHMFASFISQMVLKGKVKVDGLGFEKRDLLYIGDFVDFIKLILQKENKHFDIYNVGYGKSFLVSDIALKIDSNSVFNSDRPNIPISIFIDIEKAKSIGWNPKTSIDDGISISLDWYRKNCDKV